MAFVTLITFLIIENNNRNIHKDPWIKSDRDSIRNSCDVFYWCLPLVPEGCWKSTRILAAIGLWNFEDASKYKRKYTKHGTQNLKIQKKIQTSQHFRLIAGCCLPASGVTLETHPHTKTKEQKNKTWNTNENPKGTNTKLQKKIQTFPYFRLTAGCCPPASGVTLKMHQSSSTFCKFPGGTVQGRGNIQLKS